MGYTVSTPTDGLESCVSRGFVSVGRNISHSQDVTN